MSFTVCAFIHACMHSFAMHALFWVIGETRNTAWKGHWSIVSVVNSSPHSQTHDCQLCIGTLCVCLWLLF